MEPSECRTKYQYQPYKAALGRKVVNHKASRVFKRDVICLRIFLLRCRKEKVMPRFILDKMKILNSIYEQRHKFGQEIDKMKTLFCQKILNMEIAICYSHIHNINQQISQCEMDMEAATTKTFT